MKYVTIFLGCGFVYVLVLLLVLCIHLTSITLLLTAQLFSTLTDLFIYLFSFRWLIFSISAFTFCVAISLHASLRLYKCSLVREYRLKGFVGPFLLSFRFHISSHPFSNLWNSFGFIFIFPFQDAQFLPFSVSPHNHTFFCFYVISLFSHFSTSSSLSMLHLFLFYLLRTKH